MATVPVTLVALPVKAPVKVVAVTAPVVIVDVPLSMFPNPDVIEPESSAPTSVTCD